LFDLFFNPEDGSNMTLRNIGQNLEEKDDVIYQNMELFDMKTTLILDTVSSLEFFQHNI
jgi:hypothetical protein